MKNCVVLDIFTDDKVGVFVVGSIFVVMVDWVHAIEHSPDGNLRLQPVLPNVSIGVGMWMLRHID